GKSAFQPDPLPAQAIKFSEKGVKQSAPFSFSANLPTQTPPETAGFFTPGSRLRSVAPTVSPNGARAASRDSSHRWNQWQAPVLGPSVQPQTVGVPTRWSEYEIQAFGIDDAARAVGTAGGGAGARHCARRGKRRGAGATRCRPARRGGRRNGRGRP